MRINLKAAKLAALMAVMPIASACTLSVDGRMGEETATASATAAPEQTEAASTDTETETSAPDIDSTSTETSAVAEPSSPQTAEPDSPAGNGSADNGDNVSSGNTAAPPAKQRIPVPSGSGIQSLELVDIYGADSSGSYGRAVGVFNVTTDRPLLIKLRLTLFDAAGKQIATNDGLNPAYRVGTYTLVTSNLIKLPEGATPKTFKVSLVDTTPMRYPEFSRFDAPRIKDRAGTPILTGTFTYTGEMRSGMDSRGACILPNGKIVSGTENLVDNPTTSAGGGARTGTYEIPLYDAANDKIDLSQATCYASV